MCWLLVTALAGPAAGQPNEAEKLFRAMGKKVRAAKSLKLVCELSGSLSDRGEHLRITASRQFAGASKARFELGETTEGGTERRLFASDGRRMLLRVAGRADRIGPADPRLNEGLTAAIARGGFMLPRLVVEPGADGFDAD